MKLTEAAKNPWDIKKTKRPRLNGPCPEGGKHELRMERGAAGQGPLNRCTKCEYSWSNW